MSDGCSPVRQQLRDAVRARRSRALLDGYFWIPCPVCAEPFGGFECSRLSVPTGDDGGSTSSMTCLACEYEVGIRASESCREHGHSMTEVWGMVRPTHERVGNSHSISGTFELGRPPTERYCAVCFVDLPAPPSAPFEHGE